MDDFYTDEPIGWRPPDNLDDEGNPIDDDESLHSWDYYEPAPEEEVSWQQWNVQRKAPDSPDRIQQLLNMIDSQPWQITMTKSFYEQALFMADFDDDAPIVPFNHYFPSYRCMTVDQIRSYFTIRKMLRRGQFPDVSLSYIFVYVYETLMQIGIRTPEEGYEILQELMSGYSSEPKLKKYVGEWIKDYVVYYNLKEHFAEIFPDEQLSDGIAETIDKYKDVDDKALVEVISSISKYNLLGGVLFRKEPDKALAGTAAALRAIIPVTEQEYGNSITTLLFGKRVRLQTPMFQNAVFYSPNPIINAEINISPRHRYICSGGLWTRDTFVSRIRNVGSLFKSILREIDCQLRNILHIKPSLKTKDSSETYSQTIGKALAEWDSQERREEAEREAERRKIKIDFGKLGNIREDAGVVQDKLLDGIELEDDVPNATIEEQQPKPQSNESKEKTFLRLFLSGGDWQQYLRDIHTPEGVMVENINNMAMDTIGDIVLEDSGDGLELIEDYRQDIEEYINDNGQQ